MLWPSILGFGIIAVYVVWIMDYFCTIRRTPSYLLVALFCAVYIPFSIILLVPIDLASSTSDNRPLLELPREVTFATWRVLYWLAFFLTWLILPLLQSYLESGHNDNSKKIRDALRANARYQLITLAVGMIGLLYFYLYAGLSLTSLKALIIALSHSYSLILSIWFMGIGVVQIPRALFLKSSPARILASLERRAPILHDHLEESQTQFKEVTTEIRSLIPVKNGPYNDWIDSLLDEVPKTGGAPRTLTRSQVTEEYLSSLSYRLRKSKIALARYEHEWNSLIQNAADIIDIVDADGSWRLRFKFRKSTLSPRLAYFQNNFLRPGFYKIGGIVTSCFSVILIWSEFAQGTRASILGFISISTFGFIQELLSFAVIAYMCIAAYSSLANVKVFNIYVLARKHTDARSAIFYASQACRLTIPLSFSYVSMVPRKAAASVFEEFLQPSINLTPLGKYFVIWLPRFILVPVLFSYFKLYDRVQRVFGFEQEFGDDDELVGSRAEGRDLINYELINMRSEFQLERT
ncbi:LMBR1-like membrane protein [Lipomyces kononenkoae]|uniref:LMBR1-like membrane protein n=1 Tax=Lipomyces kononenkoae TaxID=34357 RepID=A0ACC3SV04_LIPKO